MQSLVVKDLRSEYNALVDMVYGQGEVVAPRGIGTREIRDMVLVFDDAYRCTFPAGIGRGVSTRVLAAEMMQWIAGVSDLKQLASVNSAFLKFTDDQTTLYGAYGPRAWRSLARAVEVLSTDHFSRQATVPIWRADEAVGTKDLPCTVSWSFLIRDGQLHMSTYMRSNDVWTGVAYDVPIMGRILTAMAWALNVEPGSYTHHAQSMHVYESDIEKALSMHIPDNVIEPPFFNTIDRDVSDDPVTRWDAIRNWAHAAMFNAPGIPDEMAYYGSLLADTERGRFFCTKCRYFIDVANDCQCRTR